MADESTAESNDLLAMADYLKGERGTYDTHCQEIANYVMPRKAFITDTLEHPSTEKEERLHDSRAVQAATTLANGQLSYITPADDTWFSADAPDELKDSDEAKMWYAECSERMRKALALSNFYTCVHEAYFQDTVFGTAGVHSEMDDQGRMHFFSHDAGTYSICENHLGLIDSIYKDVKYTLKQAVGKFGLKELPKQMQELWESGKPQEKFRKYDFVHVIAPRENYDATKRRGNLDPRERFPVRSTWIERISRKIVRESGYDEMPTMVFRHLKWGSESVYGWAPSWTALAEARGLNFIQKMMTVLAEVSAFPRILMPSNFEGLVDLTAGGVTEFNPSLGTDNQPREWATQGRFDIGLKLIEMKHEAIDQAFYVPMLQMFRNKDALRANMTATQIIAMENESVIQFSPSFARKTTEFLNPLLARVFGLMLRAGQMPPIPAVFQQVGMVPSPDVVYSSKIALAIKQMSTVSFARTMEMLMISSDIRPEQFDNISFDTVTRDLLRNNGVPSDWIAEEDAVQGIREARAADQQRQAEMEQAQMMADAAGKAGNIPGDTPVGGKLKEALDAV